MKLIILMFGYVATLKTTLAKHLSKKFHLKYISTKEFWPIKKSSERHERYLKLFKKTSSVLKRNQKIILDGTFCKNKYRKKIYDIANKKNIENVYLIYCVSNKKNIKKRLKGKKDLEPFAVTEFEDGWYEEPIHENFKNKLIPVIKVNIDNHKILIKNDDKSKLIKNMVSEIKNILNK